MAIENGAAGMVPAHRSFTYPLSHADQQLRASPFAIRQSDSRALESSEAFQIIRKLFSNQQDSSFCESHLPLTKADEETWLLHRDITHAIILPVLHIHRQASEIAQSFLCSKSIFDLELAFTGEARGAFSWLQCLIGEEDDWCSTRGCPACAVTYVLESEPTIRLVLVACRLSRFLRKQASDRNLPLFDFWRSSLRKALDNDPFWGPTQAKEIEARAAQLEQGLLQLIQQSCQLSDIIAANEDGTEKERLLGCPTPYHAHAEDSSKRKLSILAKQQQTKNRLPEEQGWMRKIVVGCWTTLLADAASARIATTQTGSEHDISAERRKSMAS
ncbi:hypothetical protein MMC30_002000 [Trapelia coarctata]|nr:hypothetical protein [Trapelia coarctata]